MQHKFSIYIGFRDCWRSSFGIIPFSRSLQCRIVPSVSTVHLPQFASGNTSHFAPDYMGMILHQNIFRLWCVTQLDATYPGTKIGHGGLVAWLPRSQTFDFFFWSHMKSLNYSDLWVHWRISHHGLSSHQQTSLAHWTPDTFEHVRQSLFSRCQLYIFKQFQ